MATFYIQLENRLLQISGDLTNENISKALGYVPVSPNMTNELSQRIDNITFDSLKDNPFLQDGSGELNIVDEAGNIIAKIDAEGIHSVDFIAGEHKLSNKTDKTYVDEAVKNVKVDLTGYATEEYVNNIEFYNIKNNPIVNNGDGKLLFVDENGYIGLQLEDDGLYVKDVIADGHTLSQKADKSDIPSLDGYATESYVNTELENYATKEDIKDIASNSTLIELSGKVSTLIGEDADKSVRDIAVDVLTETLVSETATEAYDTLAEMSAWIKSHPEDASAMNTAIQKNATDITNLDTAYKAADAKVLTDAQEYADNINFFTIKDNPIVDNNDGNLTFVDETGNIGLQFSNNAILVNDVITPEHTLSSKADKSELPTKISELENDKGYITSADIPEIEIPSLDEYVKSEDLPNFNEFAKTSDIPSLEGYAKLEDIPEIPEIPSLDEYVTETELNDKGFLTEHQDISNLATKDEVSESIADIDFYNIQNNPVINNEEGKLLFVDETGNIGLQLEGDVLYVKDVVANNHILSEKANKNYVDEEINQINAKINSYNTTTQTIELTKGWNWVSFYVETSLEKIQNALGTKGIEIKYMDFTTSYDEESGLWLSAGNPLTSIEPSKMYMINTNSDCVIELEGKLLEDVEITLNPGVNWIAYPLNVSMDVNMAFMHLEVTDGDDIKNDKRGFSGYLEGWGWDGNLSILEPGQGYIYTNNSSETKTFKYPIELDIKLLSYETKEDSISKLQESKDYTDTKTDELRDVVTQTLSLHTGNNWCSFYVDITLEQLQQAFGTNVTSITTSFDSTTEVTSSYDANTNTWSGDLTTLDVTKMYIINVNTDCEISLTGRKIPNSTSYTLNPGWNWISYPINEPTLINEALKGLVATEGDKIKFRGNTYAEYFDGEWFPEDFVFEPGQGYMYKNTSTESKTLVFTTELIDTKSELNKKQDVLVSGTNIKTVNGESLLGEGNIVISGETNMSNYYTKEEIDNTVGDINTILETIING